MLANARKDHSSRLVQVAQLFNTLWCSNLLYPGNDDKKDWVILQKLQKTVKLDL